MTETSMLRVVVGLTLAILTASAGAQAVALQSSAKSSSQVDSRINVSFSGTSIENAIRTIAQRSGTRIMFSASRLPSKRVTYKGEDVTAMVALSAVLSGTGVAIERAVDGSIKLVSDRGVRPGKGQGVLAGKVTDGKTARPVSGATVSVDGNGGAVTGEDGSFRIAGVSAGTRTIVVRLVGYAKQTKSVTVGEGATITVDFKLEPSANVLDQVVVTGVVVATELRAIPNAITIITAKQIEERGITKIDQLFRGDIPGLFALNMGSGTTLDEVFMFSRGATALSGGASAGVLRGTNPIKTYLDGVELADPKYLSQIDPKSIERIEILNGPQASTIYGSNAINGVMQIFTKRGNSARPKLMASFRSGIAQNNLSSSLAPTHTGDTQLSGIEGRVSYNVGGFGEYIGSWTPAVKTTRYGISAGGHVMLSKLSVDLNARYGRTSNIQGGGSNQNWTLWYDVGIFQPEGIAGRTTKSTSSQIGRTSGATVAYAPAAWWSHELVLGTDVTGIQSLGSVPRYTLSVGDSLNSYSSSSIARSSERYSTTLRLPFQQYIQGTLTFGADHWRTRSFRTEANGVSLVGSLGNPVINRDKPAKNSGGFLQGQLSVNDKLFFTYGLRGEWNPNYGKSAQPNIAPRYGVAYTMELNGVTAKMRGSYGRSTRPPASQLTQSIPLNALASPGTFTRFGQFDTQLGNLDLGPEYQQGGEGGIELYLGNRGSLVVTRFNQTVDALISQVTGADSVRSLMPTNSNCSSPFRDVDGYCYRYQSQYLNVGSIRNQGWELQSSINLGRISNQSTYSWTKSRVIGITPQYRSRFAGNAAFDVGRPADFLPEHTWATTVSYNVATTSMSLTLNGNGQLYRDFDELRYNANPNTTLRIPSYKLRMDVPTTYRAIGKSYTLAHLNIAHRFSNTLDGMLQMLNLTDFYQPDYDPLYAAMGRQTKIGLRFHTR